MSELTANIRSERCALVLYGSETGTAQDAADEVGQMMIRLRFRTQVGEMNSIDVVGVDVDYIMIIEGIALILGGQGKAHQVLISNLCHLDCRPGRSTLQCSDILEEPVEETSECSLSVRSPIYHVWNRG